jgi:hypothetical protein
MFDSYVVSIENNNVVISRGLEHHLTVIKSVDDYYSYWEAEARRRGCDIPDLHVYNSSTMDFPNESTSDPDTLELVRTLNELR